VGFLDATRYCISANVELFPDAIERLSKNEAAKAFLNFVEISETLVMFNERTNFLRQFRLMFDPILKILNFCFQLVYTHSVHDLHLATK
jgi:hypothetical protein